MSVDLLIIPLQTINLTKTTAAQNEVALSYHNVRGLYFLAVVLVTNIVHIYPYCLHCEFPHIYLRANDLQQK